MVNTTGGSPYIYLCLDGSVNRYKNHLCQKTYIINIKAKNGYIVNINLTVP